MGMVHRFNGRGYLVGPAGLGLSPNRTDIKSLGLVIRHAADEALQSRSSWERIYNIIEADVAGCIVFGQYRIVETEMARHFKVSRTVVRDVLGRLHERGLVRKNQSSHWVAGPLTAKTIKDHFTLRRLLEPEALISAAPNINPGMLADLLRQLQALEQSEGARQADDLEDIEMKLIDTCVLSASNDKLTELIRNNLLQLGAAGRLLRRLGLPEDQSVITELRLIAELLTRNVVKAAAAMLDAHLDAAAKRTVAQMKIVSIIPGPSATADYLNRMVE